MKLKEILKPDWRKIIAFVILGIISYFIIQSGGETRESIGFPLPYLVRGCPGAPPINYIENFCTEEIFYPFIVIDIISWYLLSYLIIWVYDKVKKK